MNTAEHTKAVVDAYYQAGARGDLPAFTSYLAPDFSVTAPDYLPWGGTHVGKAFFSDVLNRLPDTLYFGRFRYDKFVAEDTNALALITIGVAGTHHSVVISEHWEVKNGLTPPDVHSPA